jgi:PleD family two-component response regulator
MTDSPRIGPAPADAMFRAVFDATFDPIVVIDRAGLIRSVNKATERVFGYKAGGLTRQCGRLPRAIDRGAPERGTSEAARERLVYVVDDDEAVRESLLALLDAKGYSVRTFALAREFLAAAPTLRPGVLIADICMPEMDGLELQQALTARAFRFPLIIITGHGDVPLAVRAMKEGAIDFIEKPFATEAGGAIIAAKTRRGRSAR